MSVSSFFYNLQTNLELFAHYGIIDPNTLEIVDGWEKHILDNYKEYGKDAQDIANIGYQLENILKTRTVYEFDYVQCVNLTVKLSDIERVALKTVFQVENPKAHCVPVCFQPDEKFLVVGQDPITGKFIIRHINTDKMFKYGVNPQSLIIVWR